jgi:aspartyl protease family protein
METGGQLLYALGALVLVGSSLAARRLPMGEMLRMFLAWVAIFGVLFILFSFRVEFKQIWNRVTADLGGTANQNVVGSTVQIKRGDDGHFSVLAVVNGRKVPFLIESGATITTLSSESATEAGIEFDRSSYPVIVNTANGKAKSWRAQATNLKVESISMSELDVHVADNLGETNLLGMNFLDKLRSWKVQGDVMILEP